MKKKNRKISSPKKEKSKIPKVLQKNKFPIVGIGASAGGLNAFIQLLSKIPVDTGMAFVLVQHLDPTHPSLSAEIISKSIPLKIEEVTDVTRVKANHVYVIPPNHNMEILNGILHLSAREEAPSQNVSIDFFLDSLAQSEKDWAIGIVLSGSGSDGTRGLQSIKTEGGITFVQNPESAKYQDMPRSAISAGVADFILAPEQIAFELSKIARRPHLAALQGASSKKNLKTQILSEDTETSSTEFSKIPEALELIFKLLRLHTKTDFSDYKQTTIRRRIQRRMVVQKTKGLAGYAQYLQGHNEEILALYNDILINVTDFFRDSESYKSLTKNVFPALLKNKPAGSSIRIWIPGCSTGEEVYSIAISLMEFLGETGQQHPIQIFATDISEQCLQKARIGQYPESIIQNVSKERLSRFFDKVEGGYKVRKMVRDLCLFSRHDVIRDPPFAKLDLVSCRNLLIYFSIHLQKRVIPIFHYALRTGGFLWLGRSENPGKFSKIFRLVDKTHKIYIKSNVPSAMKFHFPSNNLREVPDVAKNISLASKVEADFKKDADKLILSIYAPPSVIINSEFEILQFRGRTFPYLEPAIGLPSFNLLKMARPELLSGLRAVVQVAKKENRSVLREGLQFEAEGRQIKVDIEAVPTNSLTPLKERTYLVLFKKSEDAGRVIGKKKSLKKGQKYFPDERDQRISELMKELSENRDYQQSLIEQYEMNQGELTSTNEELQNANEEFLSANEEIETAKEELQSTNEELTTVNDELQIRNTDLTNLSEDLNNLLASVEIPVLIVGGDHRVRRFSPKAKSAFNLIESDVGRPIGDIKSNFNLNLEVLVGEVVESLTLKEIEVQDLKGFWWQIQIRPFKTVDNKIDGAIIAVIDIDVLKQNEISAKETLEHITAIAETVPIPMAVVNREFQFRSANKSFNKYFCTSNEALDKSIFSALGIGNRYMEILTQLFSESLRDNKPFADYEIVCEVPKLGLRKVLLSGGKIHWIGAEQAAVLVSFVDVTEQRGHEEGEKLSLVREREARRQADAANRAKDVFLASLSHELRTPLSSILTWAQLICQGKVDFEKAKLGASIIEQSAKTQSQLIDDLLDISRIISGKMVIDIKPIDPAIAIQAAIEAVKPLAEKKSILIKTELCAEMELIYADAVRLQQIIWNILTNAVKFSSKDSLIQVDLKYIEEQKKRFAQIIISDNGKGIPPKFLPEIFNRFSQADSTSTRVHGGLGLGLSIVHNLVEMQSGKVTAQNAKTGSGAVFTVTFPLIPIHESPIAQLELADEEKSLLAVNSEIKSPPKLDGLRILFVDDDEVAREAISIYLKSFGAEILSVESAIKALEVFPDFKPHVLVSDIAMPIVDGYSLMRKIRRMDSDLGGEIPAIALTAYATPDNFVRAQTAGFQDQIAKPVEAHELGRRILKIAKL